ncbi:MAG: Two component sensor kinase/response regulator hybrid protein [Cypionkella sp.]|uniref:response regulator n=1 Tax=Cypionkella sp. TaxID=2811411 RepID=UPI002625EEDB|nr:response regulator [Cypionkella sp.]MDB5657590.1 Two component sensor kinase/response regulator hybrid protein [Cypionkella sp.]
MKNDRHVVLVVEDSPLIRLNVLDILVRAGHEALEAENADEAILILEAREDIDLVFTDVTMFGSMNGIDLCHYVRISWPRIKLIVASGTVYLRENSLPKGWRFLSKPYTEITVKNAVSGLLGD